MSSTAIKTEEPRQLELLSNLLPDAFSGGVGRIPCNPVVTAFLEAIAKGGKRARRNGWIPNSKGSPIYVHSSKASSNEGQILVYPAIPRGADKESATKEEEWNIVEKFGSMTYDVVLSCLSQICERRSMDGFLYPAGNPRPDLATAIMTADTILRNKEIVCRGAQRKKMYPRIETAMGHLGALRYEATWRVPFISKGKAYFDTKTWKNDALFDIAILQVWQEDLYDNEDAKCVCISWSVRLGQWVKYWFTDHKPWIVNCAKILMTLDHRDDGGPQFMAKKIGLYLTLVRAAHEKSIAPFVRTILEAVGESPETSNRHSAGRTRDRFEQAFQILTEKRFLKWEWHDSRDDNDDRVKGWLQLWLNRRISVTLLVSSETASLIEPPRFGQRRKNKNDAVGEIRHKRIEANLTQTELARLLGIAQSSLSKIERGEQAPPETLLENLRKLPCLANPPARLDI